MKRIVVLLAFVAAVTGCASHPKPKPCFAGSAKPGYVQGFIDGYLSAQPDLPYTKDLRAYQPHLPHSHASYRHGWNDGRRTGLKDERQRE